MRVVLRHLITGLLTMVLATAAQAQSPAQIPVEAFGRLPRVSDIAISPDGSKLAIATQVSDVEAIDVYNLDTGVRTPLLTFDERAQQRGDARAQLRGIGWADDTRVTFDVSETLDLRRVAPQAVGRGQTIIDYWRPGVIDLQNPRPRYLSAQEVRDNEWRSGGIFLVAPVEGEPGIGRLLAWSDSYNPGRVAIFRVNLDNGGVRRLDTPGSNADTRGYDLDARGEPIARTDLDRATNRWRVFYYRNGEPVLLREGVSEIGNAEVNVLGLLHDGRIAFHERSSSNALQTLDRATGEVATLHEYEGADLSGSIEDPWTREVVGATWFGQPRRYFDPALESAWQALRRQFPDDIVRMSSWSRDRSRIVVYVEQALDGGGYYVFTPANNQMRRIAMRYPEVAAVDLGERQSITYRARDGTRIPAYLTLPHGARENLPLVVLVHGGPHSRDEDRFDWWSSFLVSRGYAVLQANFRGSTGYGREWEHAGRGQWGGLMQTDVEDGAIALARMGLADPNRTCIVGGSYGGYAALAGATLTPDRYRCAVSVAGVSDLIAMLNETVAQGGRRGMGIEWWTLSIGDRQEDRERVRSVSPVNLADRVRIPILLMHGDDDTVVPIEQSQRMLRALRAAGKDVRFVELRGDDHWLSDAPTRTQMLRELETFLAQHLGSASAQ